MDEFGKKDFLDKTVGIHMIFVIIFILIVILFLLFG
jgi:hypothetical protein